MNASSLRVLAYHRVLEPGRTPAPNPSLVSATPAQFEQQMRHLAKRYSPVSLDAVLSVQRGRGALPRNAVLLTFDDAYTDFREIIWPILRRYEIPATLFVATAYPDRHDRVFWWDHLHHAFLHTSEAEVEIAGLGRLPLGSGRERRAALREIQRHVKSIPHWEAMALVDEIRSRLGVGGTPPSEVLGWDELRALAREGVTLVAHTRNHPALPRLSSSEVVQEVQGSLEDLQRETGFGIPVFCYPFGIHDDRVVELVRKQGIELAFTCRDGHNRVPSSDPRRMRRTVVTRRTTPFIFRLRLLKAISRVDAWRHREKGRGANSPSGAGEPLRADRAPARVAHIMSRFPKLSETFVLNEILALEALGAEVEVFPLLRERQPVSHPEVEPWVRRAHFHPFLSPSILRSQAHFLRRGPRRYMSVLFEVLRGTWGSPNFFVGALGIFPKSVRFAHEMEKLGITHIHAHFATHPTVAAFIAHRLTGIPFSFIAHGSDLHVERRMLDRKVEAAAFAVTVSKYNREVMVATCGEQARDKIHVIHCGVDPSFFRPAQNREGGPCVTIVCVASLEAVKGHRFLVEACRVLCDMGVDFRCDLVGDGPLRQPLEAQIAQAGLADRIHLRGGLPRPEVARVLCNADIAVLASHPTPNGKREGIPVALMEAMAAGLPVVASDLSGIPELVEHGATGYLVPTGDPHALARALARLAGDRELRERLGRAGRQKVAREFDLTSNTSELLRLFTGVERLEPLGIRGLTSAGAPVAP